MAKAKANDATGPEMPLEATGAGDVAEPGDDGTGALPGISGGPGAMPLPSAPKRVRKPKGPPIYFDLDAWVDMVLAESFGPHPPEGPTATQEVAYSATRAMLKALADTDREGRDGAMQSLQAWRRERRKYGRILF